MPGAAVRPPVDHPLTPAAFRALLAAASLYAGVTAAHSTPIRAILVMAGIAVTACVVRPEAEAGGGRWTGLLRIARVVLLTAFAGWLSADLRDRGMTPDGLDTAIPQAPYHEEISIVTGTLTDCRVLPPDRLELQITVEQITIGGRATGPRARGTGARITLPLPAGGADPPWTPGDRLRMAARLSRPRAFGNPGAFDYPAWLRARGIHLVGTVKSPLLVERLGRASWVAGLSARIRSRIVRRIESGGGRYSGPFLAALLVGERSGLGEEIEEPLQRAGVYHIVALSGLNVAWLAGLVSFLARGAGAHPRLRRWLIMGAIATYWWIAPTSGSMERASLMGLIYLGSQTLTRRVVPAAALGTAAGLMLVVDPAWAVDPGFQLSLAATLAILLVAPIDSESILRRSRVPGLNLVAGSVRISSGALAGTVLIGAHYFHRVSAAAIPANLAAVPIAAALLALGALIALCGGQAAVVGACAASIADWLLSLLVSIATRVADLPGLAIWVVPPPAVAAAASLAAMILGYAAPRRSVRAVGWAVFAGLLFITLAAGRSGRASGILRVIALDVGQGDAVLVELPTGGTILVDAGGRTRTGFDFGSRVVAPAIRARGHLRLDLLGVTHAHQDHLGGATSILRQFHPDAVWVGRMPPCDSRVRSFEREATALGIPVVSPRRGVSAWIGNVRVEVLNPRGPDSPGPAANDDSLVLRLGFGRRHALLTGDIEGELEVRLVREGSVLHAELLKVAHHGSRTSTTPELLDQVQPQAALISVGRVNPWGHPDTVVLERLRRAGVQVWRTDQDGAACLETGGEGRWRPCGADPGSEDRGSPDNQSEDKD